MNREVIKSLVKKIVLQEITKADYGVGSISTKDDVTAEFQKAVKAAGGEMIDNPLNSVIAADDKQGGKKFQIELYEVGADNYYVTAIFNGSERKTAKGLTVTDAISFVKKGLEDSKTTYVDKARAKSINAAKVEPKKADKKKEDQPKDEMEETEEKTQSEISDKNDKKAEEKVDKKIAPISSESAPQMGGDLVDKIDKIIDRVLKAKNKAEPTTPFLKTDTSKESPDKLTVKDKGTPELKEKKK